MSILSDIQVFVGPETSERYAHIKSSPGQKPLWGPEDEKKHPRGHGGKWASLPQEGRTGFENHVLAPLRAQVEELDQVKGRLGPRYAWEVSTHGGKTVDSPHAGSEGLKRWSEHAKAEGHDPDELLGEHEEYQDLTSRLRKHRGWGNEPEFSPNPSSTTGQEAGTEVSSDSDSPDRTTEGKMNPIRQITDAGLKSARQMLDVTSKTSARRPQLERDLAEMERHYKAKNEVVAAAQKRGFIRNKFNGTASDGTEVKAGAGFALKDETTGKWKTYSFPEVQALVGHPGVDDATQEAAA